MPRGSALGHHFGGDLVCSCGVEWMEHQRNPKRCPGSSLVDEPIRQPTGRREASFYCKGVRRRITMDDLRELPSHSAGGRPSRVCDCPECGQVVRVRGWMRGRPVLMAHAIEAE